MGTRHFVKKNKRRVIITCSIIGSVILINAVLLSFVWLYLSHEGSVLRFLAGALYGDNLTEIVGEPEPINVETYDYSSINAIFDESASFFPCEITCGTVKYYAFHERLKKGKYNRFEVYVEWSMPTAIYQQEIERISAYSPKGETAEFSMDLFPMPSYVASYNTYFSFYQYALLDGSANTIRYIEFENIGNVDQIVFSRDFAPQKLLKDSDLAKHSTITGVFDIY